MMAEKWIEQISGSPEFQLPLFQIVSYFVLLWKKTGWSNQWLMLTIYRCTDKFVLATMKSCERFPSDRCKFAPATAPHTVCTVKKICFKVKKKLVCWELRTTCGQGRTAGIGQPGTAWTGQPSQDWQDTTADTRQYGQVAFKSYCFQLEVNVLTINFKFLVNNAHLSIRLNRKKSFVGSYRYCSWLIGIVTISYKYYSELTGIIVAAYNHRSGLTEIIIASFRYWSEKKINAVTVLFSPEEQKNTTGTLLHPAAHRPWSLLGGFGGPLGSSDNPHQTKPSESIPRHMAQFARITCLECGLMSCPCLF